ncbi:MAG: AAA family ATPase [Ignavibacteriaceae bacterium]|nr:AAA family ATPase [Ignavibacteriaceae bacterium]
MTIDLVHLKKELTASQYSAINSFSDFLRSDKQVFILKGYAGTGKTYLIKILCDNLKKHDRQFYLMAPTGRAAKVIRQKTGFKAYTIHKSIYSFEELAELIPQTDSADSSFKYYYKLRVNNDNSNCIYIIDEASMISDVYTEEEFFRFGSGYLLKDLFDYCNTNSPGLKRKIIFVGDDCQLPPVNTNFSFALSESYIESTYNVKCVSGELTEVVRQVGNSGIIEIASKIRESISLNNYNYFSINCAKPDVIQINPESVVDTYLKNYGENSTVIVAGTNKQVYDYNMEIRSRLFPGKAEITPGDKILITANSYNRAIELLNGDIGEVVEVSSNIEVKLVPVRNNGENIKVDLKFRDAVLRFPDSEGTPVDIACKILENILTSDQRSLSSDETKALYINFKMSNPELHPKSQEFKDKIKTDPYFNALRVKYGYALTCHKAQGGEWENVIVDFYSNTGILNRQYFRWAYTAVTRAKFRLYSVNAVDYKAPIQLQDTKEPLGITIPEFAPDFHPLLLAFPGDNILLRKLYLLVVNTLKDTNFSITKVEHLNWCERYLITDEINSYCFDVYYNKKNQVTNINYIPPKGIVIENDLSLRLKMILGSIVNKKLLGFNPVKRILAETDFNDKSLFLFIPLEKACAALEKEKILLYELNSSDWKLQLKFFRGNDLACVDLYYNSHNCVTSLFRITKESSSVELLDIVQNILLETL